MLSIIIPTKNEAENLPRLLKSILAQTVQPQEIIVADAGSTDGTRAIARTYGAKVVKGGMPGEGRNKGAQAASFDVLLFLDADVVLEDPKFLEKSMGEFYERKLDVASCDAKPITEQKIDQVLYKAYNTYARVCGSVLPHAAGFCIFAKASMHKKIGGFDETIVFCEDHDYARRAAKVGEFGILNTAVPVSARRMSRDGRANIALKFALAELHLVTKGPIRHDKFNYTFGHKSR